MKIKLIIIFFISVFSIKNSFSQEEFSGGSPYSIFGIGDINYNTSARTNSMGVLGVSLFGNYINILNPAALTKLKATTISFNINYGFLKSTNGVINNKVSNGNVYGLNIGVPLDQGMGWVFTVGFNPYSLLNYKIQITGNKGGQNYTQTYSGKGGLSRINAGMTYNLFQRISIGLEYDYAFGEIKNQNFINFNNSGYTNTDIKKENDFQKSFLKGGLILEVGKIFRSPVLKNLSFGFVYQSKINLNSTQDGIYNSSIGTDTVRLNTGIIEIPDGYGFGITNIFGNKYLVSGDILIQNWGNYSEYGNKRKDFQTSIRAGLGFEIIPDPKVKSFWKSLTYRFGGFYDKAFYKVYNENITGYGINAGVNIPINQYNSIDFGISYSTRGKTENGLIKDEYLNLSAGVNFGELWFLRPREEDK